MVHGKRLAWGEEGMKRGIIFFGVFFLLWAGLFAMEGWAQTKAEKGGRSPSGSTPM